jgi:IS5 family transposase
MLKILILQQCHSLFDWNLRKQCIDRISVIKLIGFPEYIQDSPIVNSFQKILITAKMEKNLDKIIAKKNIRSL